MSKRIQRKREKNRYVHPNPSRLYIILPENPSTKKEDPQPLAELEITGNVRNLSLSLFQMTHLTSLYLNDNCLRSIPGEVNQLVNLAHLNVAHNQLREIPPQMGDLVSLRELILSHNFLTTLPCEIGKLFKLSKLELEGNPLPNQVLDLWSHSSGIEELLNYLLENLPFNTECPPDRPWIQLLNPNPSVSSCTFTVMCYNVLCDKYATRQLYGYCPNWALDWDYRKKIIMSEILRYKADILSLQEVETEQFYNFFLPELKREGYDGIFSPKSRAKTMSECERKHVDGCAIFFKTNKFFLVKEYLVEFNQLAIANAEGSNDMLNRVMTKDNIGLAALLQTRLGAYAPGSDTARTNQTLLVCTAHIHWDPEYSDVKLIQTMMLMHELQSIVKDTLQKCDNPNVQKDDVNSIPLLLCGDFNSLPNSGVIEFLTSGRVSTKHCDFKQIVYEECLKKLKNSIRSKEFAHPFQISRAYNDEIMPFTNYSYSFKGVIDYVFYSHLHMSILGVLGAIDEKWFRTNKIHGCPHPHVPSDHFPILVELQFAPTEPIHPAPPNGIALHR